MANTGSEVKFLPPFASPAGCSPGGAQAMGTLTGREPVSGPLPPPPRQLCERSPGRMSTQGRVCRPR